MPAGGDDLAPDGHGFADHGFAGHGFADLLRAWYRRHGRHDLPWQRNRDPYCIWVSEIMLQQTRVHTVIPYFSRFIHRFPNPASLAAAGLDEVLHLWSGLGYYARARALHRCARMICNDHAGEFPTDIDTLLKLPGIGRSTAGAILSLSLGRRQPILDGNVKRVLTRYRAIRGWPGTRQIQTRLWALAEQLTPEDHVAEYNQAIMDLGATVCVRRSPDCTGCPLTNTCRANRLGVQHDLPSPKPKQNRPLKTTRFIMLENHRGEVFLQQRPPTGVWGGLWSFPECAAETDLETWIYDTLGYKVSGCTEKRTIRHTFSHFHLDITPVHVRVKPLPAMPPGMIRETAPHYWYSAKEPPRLGLPAPVKRLLKLSFGDMK